jgi:hypothetical protein
LEEAKEVQFKNILNLCQIPSSDLWNHDCVDIVPSFILCWIWWFNLWLWVLDIYIYDSYFLCSKSNLTGICSREVKVTYSW